MLPYGFPKGLLKPLRELFRPPKASKAEADGIGDTEAGMVAESAMRSPSSNTKKHIELVKCYLYTYMYIYIYIVNGTPLSSVKTAAMSKSES